MRAVLAREVTVAEVAEPMPTSLRRTAQGIRLRQAGLRDGGGPNPTGRRWKMD